MAVPIVRRTIVRNELPLKSNGDDDFCEFQDEDTDGEADDYSDSSEEKLFDDDEIEND